MKINRIPVSSSNIASIGYDENSMILEVEFLNGSIYQYHNVPKYVYENFLKAGSKGQYFYYNIRNAGYLYYKVA